MGLCKSKQTTKPTVLLPDGERKELAERKANLRPQIYNSHKKTFAPRSECAHRHVISLSTFRPHHRIEGVCTSNFVANNRAKIESFGIEFDSWTICPVCSVLLKMRGSGFEPPVPVLMDPTSSSTLAKRRLGFATEQLFKQ